MNKKLQTTLELSMKIMNNDENTQLLEQERQKNIDAIKVCQDIITDILNHMRYYPEAVLCYKERLEEATAARD